MAGIYIHIPFCKKKCTYCDFHFSTSFSSYRDEMINSICKEIIRRNKYLNDQLIETIYFGGGTPSLLTFDELNSIMFTIQSNFQIAENPEITLEANPDDLNEGNLKIFSDLGINRLSIGLQSFRKEDLEWMNRAHTVEESFNCVRLAQEFGFKNISIDLIYGLPNLSIETWSETLQIVFDLNVQHISAYCLTVENKTVLNKWVNENRIKLSDEDEQSDQFELLIQKLSENNFNQYEISNFSRPNFESKHNSNYWKGKHYLGVGPSAHSFDGITRSWNISNNSKYIQLINSNIDSFEFEILSKKDLFNELLMIGLRTAEGVNLIQLEKILPFEIEFLNQIEVFTNDFLLLMENDRIKLTEKGKLKADFIASKLFL